MTRLAAIDFSANRARFVVIDSTLRRSSLTTADAVIRDPEEDDVAFWTRVEAALPANVDSLIINAEASAVSTRLLNFPFGDVRKVDQILDFELENQIPYDIEDVIVTSQVVQRSKAKTTMLTAITPRAQLGERLADLDAAGLEPRAVVVPAAVLSELVSVKSAEPVAIVDLGASQSHLCIVDSHTGLRFARTLRVGGDGVDRHLARVFSIEITEADQLKKQSRLMGPHEIGSERELELSNELAAGLGPVITALATTFKSLPLELAPTRVVLTGGLSRLSGLPDYISRRLGIDVELLDLHASLGNIVCDRSLGPEYAAAVGMVLSLMRRGRNVPLNVRRGPFAYSGDMQLYRTEILRGAIGIGAIMILAIIAAIIRFAMVSAIEAEINQAFCDTTNRIVGREICDPTAALATMRQAPGVEAGVVIPEYSAAVLYEMISKAIGQDVDVNFSILDFKLDSGSGDPDRISGKGEAASFEATEQVVAALKKDPCVQEAEITKQKKGTSGRVQFRIAIKVKCPPGRLPGSELGEVAAVTPQAESPPAPAVPTPPPTAVSPAPSRPQRPSLIPPTGVVTPPHRDPRRQMLPYSDQAGAPRPGRRAMPSTSVLRPGAMAPRPPVSPRLNNTGSGPPSLKRRTRGPHDKRIKEDM